MTSATSGSPERPATRRRVHVTVAVCTRDHPLDLERCLSALVATGDPACDVLVVDNAPATDAARRLVHDRYSTVAYVCEPRPGLSHARNRAIATAGGEIVAFIDDDVVVLPGWLHALVAAFDAPEVMAVTGQVVPFELESESQIHFERYGGFGGGEEPRTFPPEEHTSSPDPAWALECGTGANMAFRREVFAEVGDFDPALGAGTPTNGGDDLEMFYRVLKRGHSLRYAPEAVVSHRHRVSPEDLRIQIRGWGSGLVAYALRSARAYPEERRAFALLGSRWLGRQLRRFAVSLLRPPGFPRRLILIELGGAARGFHLYRKSLRASRREESDEAA